jgi:multidrug efflux pump subunit AcrA (membrane-fusion protein)
MKVIKAFPNRKWVIKVGIGFLIVMGLLTFFSNTIMNYSLPQVSVVTSSGGSMTSAIKGTGTVAAITQDKITAQAVRKVDQVNFGVNEDVKAGDIIATLSEATDTEKDDLKAAQDALKALQNQKLTDDLQAPVYDYTSQQRAISDALEALNKAVLALTTSSSTELKTAQDALKTLLNQKASDDLQAPVYDYTKLERAVTDAQTALTKANATYIASQSKPTAILTAQAAVMSAQAPVDAANDALATLNSIKDTKLQAVTDDTAALATATDALTAATNANPSDPDKTKAALEAVDSAQKELNAANAALAAARTNVTNQNLTIAALTVTLTTAQTNLATANALPTTADAALAVADAQQNLNDANKALSDQKKADALAQELASMTGADKQQALADAQKKVDDLTALAAFKSTLTTLGSTDAIVLAASSMPALADEVAAVKLAQRSYDDAVKALATQKKTDGISQQIAALTAADKVKALKEAQKKVDDLTAFASQTAIVATKAGRISSINLVSGTETVKGDVVATIDVVEDGFRVPISFTSAQAAQITVGMGARLDNYGGSDSDATVVSIKPDSTDPRNKKTVTFILNDPDNKYFFTSGSSVTLTLNNKSKEYQCIIPLSAVHEESGETFVYAVKEKQSPLGVRYIAVKVTVKILAKDDSNAAIDPSALGAYGSSVITESNDKSFASGDQVRLAEGL